MEPLKGEAVVNSSLDIAWRAWTRSTRITRWFAPEAVIEACPGGSFELYFDPSDHDHQCTKGCVFTLVEPKKRLAFTWKGPDQFADLMNDPASLTSVLVSFHRVEGSIEVVVEHTGWGEGEDWIQAREWHQRAWKDVLGRLKSTLESGPSN